MVTKNCRKIIKTICRFGEEAKYGFHNTADLADATGLPHAVVCSACEQLAEEGYMEIEYTGNINPIVSDVRLTELGASYSEVQRAARLAYIASKWIDFIALIVAIIALIVSIAAFFKP